MINGPARHGPPTLDVVARVGLAVTLRQTEIDRGSGGLLPVALLQLIMSYGAHSLGEGGVTEAARPAGFTIISGASGTGKTTLARDLATRWTHGCVDVQRFQVRVLSHGEPVSDQWGTLPPVSVGVGPGSWLPSLLPEAARFDRWCGEDVCRVHDYDYDPREPVPLQLARVLLVAEGLGPALELRHKVLPVARQLRVEMIWCVEERHLLYGEEMAITNSWFERHVEHLFTLDHWRHPQRLERLWQLTAPSQSFDVWLLQYEQCIDTSQRGIAWHLPVHQGLFWSIGYRRGDGQPLNWP